MEDKDGTAGAGGGDPAEAEDWQAATRDLQEAADEVRILLRSVAGLFPRSERSLRSL